MFYHAIHARLRASGKCVVIDSGFSDLPGEPPVALVKKWEAESSDPRIGEKYSVLHRILDNKVVVSYDLPHPDKAAEDTAALRAAQDARTKADQVTEARKLIARLEQLQSEGLTEKDVMSAAEREREEKEEAGEAQREAEAKRQADEAEAKRVAEEAEAKRQADEAAAADRSGTPASDSTPTETPVETAASTPATPPASDTQPAVPVERGASTAAPPPATDAGQRNTRLKKPPP